MVIRHHETAIPTTDNMQGVSRIARDSGTVKPPWTSKPYSHPDYLCSTTQRAIDIYLLSKRPNGSMGGIGWWQSANGYTAMALHDLWSPSAQDAKHNYSILDNAIRKCASHQPCLINVFNDDTLWWGLLCMHMYSLNNDKYYLTLARDIWEHIKRSGSLCSRGQVLFRGRDMEGAVYWTTKPHEDQINAVSTALFAELSVRLALDLIDQEGHATGRATSSVMQYLEAARCSLGWVLRCRYRPQQGVVLDHIKLRRDKCVDWTFTYNTAVTLGCCALLFAATGEEDYMHLACHMACKAMTHHGWVEDDGVLTEKGAYGRGTHDPWKDNDSVGFKAVLVRQLGVLYGVIRKTGCEMPRAKETAELIKTFIDINFQSQVERNTNGNGQYGPWWDGPFECPTSHSQMAVLDVMAAVRLVNDR